MYNSHPHSLNQHFSFVRVSLYILLVIPNGKNQIIRSYSNNNSIAQAHEANVEKREMSSYTVDYSHCMFVSCFVRWRFIWDRLLWPHSSASYIYGIYYLENRRKQAKIQGNIYNSILYMFEKTQNSPTQLTTLWYITIKSSSLIKYLVYSFFFSSFRLRIPWTELKLSLYIFFLSSFLQNNVELK